MSFPRNVLALFLLALTAGTAGAHRGPRQAQQGERLRVMTYNIHHGAAASNALDLAGIAGVIRAQEADVVGLQEVDRHWAERSQFADQARLLADRLGMNVFFAPIYDRPLPTDRTPHRQYGLAILSRFPIGEQHNVEITRQSSVDDSPRPRKMGGFPVVALDVAGARVHVFDTHLDYRSDPTVRRAQVRDMLDMIEDVEGPKVLVGDFNALPDAAELRPLWNAFTDAWAVRGRGRGYTYPSEEPAKRIDYILASPSVKVDSAAVVPTSASDHRPLVADLVLPEAVERRAQAPEPVKTGARVLADGGFARLQGKTVGLVANPTARVGTTHLIDAMGRAGVEIGALFGPEHGLRGTAGAGESVAGGRNETTKAPIYSLYDETRKPTPKELDGLDALVFDIQSVGVRFYTYLTTMGLSMQAAAKAGLPFIVLDRPNPLGGTYVSGFVLEPEHTSFVGKYPLPIAHGLTVGELARMIKGEGWLPGLEDVRLKVVEMQGWERDMRWPQTGLPWLAPSPNLPTFETALVYGGTCFFEATRKASEGRGTSEPFTHLGAPWADGRALADSLNARSLPGVRFHPATFTPESNAGDSAPKFEGKPLEGLRIEVTDAAAYRPVETGIYVLHVFYQQAQRKGIEAFFTSYLKKLAGTERLQKMLRRGDSPEAIIAAWQEAVQRFRRQRQRYLLY